MTRTPHIEAIGRQGRPVSAVIRGRRILLRGPAGSLRKTRPFLTDT